MGTVDRCALYYVEMRVNDGVKVVEDFVMKYGFKIIGERQGSSFCQWILEAGKCRFMVTEVKSDTETSQLAYDPFITSFDIKDGLDEEYRTPRYKRAIDVVYNVALEVRDLEAFLKKLSKFNVIVLKPAITISDKHGEIFVATVKSCLDNIVHTLVQINSLKGHLIPGFEFPSNWSLSLNSKRALGLHMSHVDHVTFICEKGKAKSTVAWYEKCFGMKNFSLNRNSEDGSLVVKGENVGLKLSAFDYWKCSETGLYYPGTSDNKLSFVIGEPFGNSGHCHLKTFLSHQNGAGIQHVGLHTFNIIQTLQILKNNGVAFVETPSTYYEEEYFLEKVEELGEQLIEDVKDIQTNGILLDTDESFQSERYLMQKFTKPIFNRETFFLEIIQRRGASGFGSGNIMALCRAVEKWKLSQKSE